MSKKNWTINVVVNSLIIALTIVAILLMFFGDPGVLASTRWDAFKYFTTQSNLFVAITSVISLIYLLFKKDKPYPTWLTVVKLTSAVSVGVTFTVVFAYLDFVYPIALLFHNANLFLHGIIPVIAMVAFAILEPKAKLNWKLNFHSLFPVSIYGTFYLINVAAKNDYGNYKGADWYAFGTYGPWIGILCLSVILAISLAISFGLYLLHQRTLIKKLHE